MSDGIMLLTVTSSLRLYKQIFQKLNAGVSIASSNQVSNVQKVETSLSSTSFNVVIWDYDFHKCNQTYLTALVSKYNAIVIVISQSNKASAAISMNNARSIKFLAKPTCDSSLAFFADAAKKYIVKSYTSIPKLSYSEAAKTVNANERIIVIAASTGGTTALEKILRPLQPDCPPILIVQHIITGFSSFFAERLNDDCRVEVREAKSNDYLQKGLVLIAPTDQHMILAKRGDKLIVECFIGEKVNCVMPAADVLFDSVAKIMRNNVTGIILTGMGSDGARGLLKLKNAGAKTIGQDEKTSVIYGMPKVAFDIGAVQVQLPINKIYDEMIRN